MERLGGLGSQLGTAAKQNAQPFVHANPVPAFAQMLIPLTDGTYVTATEFVNAGIAAGYFGASTGTGGGTGTTTTPGAPTIAAGTPTTSTIPYTITVPTTGSAVTSYDVTYTPAGGAATTVNTTALTGTLTGLTASKAYTITALGKNAAGSGPASVAVTATTAAAAAPTAAYIVRPGGAGGSWPATANFAAGTDYIGLSGGIIMTTAAGAFTTLDGLMAIGSSPASPPVYGAAGGDYGLHGTPGLNGSDAASVSYFPQGGYPGQGSINNGAYLWRNGRTSSSNGNRYVWMIPTDTSIAPFKLTNADGSDYIIAMTFA